MGEKSVYFKIRRSYVHITDDAIKMWADTNLVSFKESSGVATLFFGIFVKLLIIGYFSFRFFHDFYGFENLRLPFVVLVAVLIIVYGWQIVYTLQFNYTNYIPRDSITHVEYKKGIPILMAGQIIVHFEKNGKRLKRSFVLSGMFQDNVDRQDALKKLKDAGLYNPGDEDEDLLDS